MKPATRTTVYSRKYPGDWTNHGLVARFDLTDDYVGITQVDPVDGIRGRVVLTPSQWEALTRFVRARRDE